MFERIIQKRLLEQVENRNIIPDFQYGFQRQHSTTQQLLRQTEHINKHYATSTPTAAVLLDVEKAFDRVWHAGLIHKIQTFGISHDLVSIIKNYLSNRTFTVKIEEEESTSRPINARVPQGSVLGPLLFNIYTSDIPKPTRTEIGQFADDTILYYSHRWPKAINRGLQSDLDKCPNGIINGE